VHSLPPGYEAPGFDRSTQAPLVSVLSLKFADKANAFVCLFGVLVLEGPDVYSIGNSKEFPG
jgi:hypothetical protein